MRHVHTFHQQVIAAYDRLSLGRGAAIDGHILADSVVVAYLGGCFLAAEFQVLRHSADHGPRENHITLAHARSAQQGDAIHQAVVVAYHHILVNITEGADFTMLADRGFGMHIGQRTYITHESNFMIVYLFFTICAVNVASMTMVSPTKAKPCIVEMPWRMGASNSTLKSSVSPGTTLRRNFTSSMRRK